MILAHQYLEQLEEETQLALLGNVGTLIVFRVGVRDAEVLGKEFWPEIGVEDLVSLPRYHVYLRLTIDGVISRPFSATTGARPENPRMRPSSQAGGSG